MAHKFNVPDMPDYGDPQHMADRVIELFAKDPNVCARDKIKDKGHVITALAALGFAGWIVAEQIDQVMICLGVNHAAA